MKRRGLTIVQRLGLGTLFLVRSIRTRLSSQAQAVERIGQGDPAPAAPPRPAEAAQAAISQARASSRPASSGAAGQADDWESF
ncbi:hypothetical protein [Aquabacterium sp.]|uniref:hypothetical protein n=1 Tax=Aquabacterium sp. TaxID=1872578 RepID=UPI002C62F3D1|nr:hypothetical protein [Aquabacterium sp.]HSW07198.1 hypothetical protein [Aquabacterium sp.]